MKQLFVIDPPEALTLYKDTSFHLMWESCRRGYPTYYCESSNVSARVLQGKRSIVAEAIQTNVAADKSFTVEKRELMDLESFDLIHIRKDPPFDRAYYYLCLLLQELTHPKVINDPKGIIAVNEKLGILAFPETITETLVSAELDHMLEFVRTVGGTAVLKSLDDASGRGVEKIDISDASTALIKERTENGRVPMMLQRFLPQIREGETRALLLGGKLVGCFKKIPAADTFKANFAFGAVGVAYDASAADLRVIEQVAAPLLARGIHFAALDIIDGHLSEINVTSPGLLVQICKISGEPKERTFIDYFESLLALP